MLKFDEKKFLLILIFLHLAIALPLAFQLNIWVDEASTLYTTQIGKFRESELHCYRRKRFLQGKSSTVEKKIK